MSAKKLEIPAQRPVASGELVAIKDLPEYKRKHGLRTVGGAWLPTEKYPRLYVEFIEKPETGEESQ